MVFRIVAIKYEDEEGRRTTKSLAGDDDKPMKSCSYFLPSGESTSVESIPRPYHLPHGISIVLRLETHLNTSETLPAWAEGLFLFRAGSSL